MIFFQEPKIILNFWEGFQIFPMFFDFDVYSPIRTNVNCFVLYSPDFWNLKAGMIFFQEPKIIVKFLGWVSDFTIDFEIDSGWALLALD